MAGFSIELVGLSEVIGRLDVMAAETAAKATEAVQGATQDALDASLPMIAVRTGFLKSQQQMRMPGGGLLILGELYNDAPYARWECFGHHTRSGSWVPGQDFMTAPILVGERSLIERLSAIYG